MYPEITLAWTDHWFDDECVSPDEIVKMKPMTHTTHGFLLAENRLMVAVAATVLEDNRGCEVTYIMKKNIVSRSDKQKKNKKNVDAGSDIRVLGSLPKD